MRFPLITATSGGSHTTSSYYLCAVLVLRLYCAFTVLYCKESMPKKSTKRQTVSEVLRLIPLHQLQTYSDFFFKHYIKIPIFWIVVQTWPRSLSPIQTLSEVWYFFWHTSLIVLCLCCACAVGPSLLSTFRVFHWCQLLESCPSLLSNFGTFTAVNFKGPSLLSTFKVFYCCQFLEYFTNVYFWSSSLLSICWGLHCPLL